MLNELWKIIRRRYYLLFNRDKMKQGIMKRKGNCNNCGLCCSRSIFGFECNNFNKLTNCCTVYNTPEMPLLCFYYPFDEKDEWDWTKLDCGYWFNEELIYDKVPYENMCGIPIEKRCKNERSCRRK